MHAAKPHWPRLRKAWRAAADIIRLGAGGLAHSARALTLGSRAPSPPLPPSLGPRASRRRSLARQFQFVVLLAS
eukprot:548432-Pyramimonas_sp.AAC.1